MIATIINLLTGNVFRTLSGLYEKKLAADNASQKLAADVAIKNIEADLAVRQNAKEIRLATAGFWEMRTITFLIATPFVIHLWAVALDTVFDDIDWRIPRLPAPFDQYQGAVLLSFFGVQVAGKALDTLAYVFGRRK
ncbi:hypothetical protein [Rhizobium phage RHph_X2_30]|nr:hypothetical protein [Rhizobium phage RHph_X2_30]